jgi:hypothetical protein
MTLRPSPLPSLTGLSAFIAIYQRCLQLLVLSHVVRQIWGEQSRIHFLVCLLASWAAISHHQSPGQGSERRDQVPSATLRIATRGRRQIQISAMLHATTLRSGVRSSLLDLGCRRANASQLGDGDHKPRSGRHLTRERGSGRVICTRHGPRATRHGPDLAPRFPPDLVISPNRGDLRRCVLHRKSREMAQTCQLPRCSSSVSSQGVLRK